MDIKGLQYFIRAAERLNFTIAAKESYITQTAMSLHIGKMEDELGFKLFSRDKRMVELTAAGKDFLRQAKLLVLNYEHAVGHSASIAAGTKGIINVMTPSCIEAFAFMEKFWEFRDEYPEVDLNILVQPPSRLISGLKTGISDLCIGSPEEMKLDTDLDVIKLREDPIVIICSKRHPFAALPEITPDMLCAERVIICEPKGMPITYRAIRNSWLQAGFEPASLLGVSNMDEMLLLIELNRGIGFLPSFVEDRIERERSGIAFISCAYSGKPPAVITALGYLKSNSNPALRNFIEIFT